MTTSPYARSLELIQRNIEATANAANTLRMMLQRQQLFAMLNDRIRAGADITFKTDAHGVYGIAIRDPVAEKARADMLSLTTEFARNLYAQIPNEIRLIQAQRRFGGEDQVQHAMLTGFLSNLTNSLGSIFRAFYV